MEWGRAGTDLWTAAMSELLNGVSTCQHGPFSRCHRHDNCYLLRSRDHFGKLVEIMTSWEEESGALAAAMSPGNEITVGLCRQLPSESRSSPRPSPVQG